MTIKKTTNAISAIIRLGHRQYADGWKKEWNPYPTHSGAWCLWNTGWKSEQIKRYGTRYQNNQDISNWN